MVWAEVLCRRRLGYHGLTEDPFLSLNPIWYRLSLHSVSHGWLVFQWSWIRKYNRFLNTIEFTNRIRRFLGGKTDFVAIFQSVNRNGQWTPPQHYPNSTPLQCIIHCWLLLCPNLRKHTFSVTKPSQFVVDDSKYHKQGGRKSWKSHARIAI